MTNYQKEQFLLEEQFVKRMLIDYGIREVTTQKQAKNGTREFEFPVPAYTKQRLKWFEGKRGSTWWKDKRSTTTTHCLFQIRLCT